MAAVRIPAPVGELLNTLEAAGHRVTEAASGDEAMQALYDGRHFDLPVALRNSDVTFSREISSRLLRASGRFNTVFLRLFFYKPEFLSGLKVAYTGEPALLASHFQKVPGDYFVIALRRIVI